MAVFVCIGGMNPRGLRCFRLVESRPGLLSASRTKAAGLYTLLYDPKVLNRPFSVR